MAKQDWLGSGGRHPFEEMMRLQDEMNRLFSSRFAGARQAPAGGFPAVNAYAGEQGVVLTAELPGVRSEDLEISAFRDTVTIRGTRRPPDDAASYHRRERRQGEFVRTINLPFAVDPSRVEAQMTQGVLYVILHRPPEDQPRRIKVRAG
jgi:HSP20 family protein